MLFCVIKRVLRGSGDCNSKAGQCSKINKSQKHRYHMGFLQNSMQGRMTSRYTLPQQRLVMILNSSGHPGSPVHASNGLIQAHRGYFSHMTAGPHADQTEVDSTAK